MKRYAICLLLTCATCSLTGCEAILHEMQPHRLWRLNYYDSPGRNDGFYSIPDRLPDESAAKVTRLQFTRANEATWSAPAQ